MANEQVKRDRAVYLSVYLILASLLFTALRATVCLKRLVQALVDLGTSIAYYVLFLLDRQDRVTPTVTQRAVIGWEGVLPFSFDELEQKCERLPRRLLDADNLNDYGMFLLQSWNGLVLTVTLVLPCVLLLLYLKYSRYTKAHVAERPRGLWRRRTGAFVGRQYRKGARAWRQYRRFLKQEPIYVRTLLVVWLLNLNLLTVAIEAVAYYFYFLVSLDLASLFGQAVKLVCDLLVARRMLPLWIWCLVAYGIFDAVRTKLALNTLRHMEAKNRGFNQSLPIAVMITGTMGSGKTRMAVDMALSFEQEFRDKARELMLNNMLRFPQFDFLTFQQALVQEIREGRVKNWAGCRQWVRMCRERYRQSPAAEHFFGYDEQKNAVTYCDGVRVWKLWDVLENYAQEYFLYVAVSSLLLSNFSIRSDVDVSDCAYFPQWNGDFFQRDPREMPQYSRYAHIIDFDLFRLGCQMNRDNCIAGAFEFGVVVLTEIGKERGNQLENQEYKKHSLRANPKNDMFNAWLKLIRHAGTVEGVCFVRLLCDEQRAASWGADARDTAAVLCIKEVSDASSALACDWLSALFLKGVLPLYLQYYQKVLLYGNARAAAIRHVHTAVSALYARCDRRRQLYGYAVSTVTVQDGTLEDEPMEHETYLSFKKVYADRYRTDCYQEYFADRALASDYDFVHAEAYQSDCATLEELEKQSSYLVTGLLAMLKRQEATTQAESRP